MRLAPRVADLERRAAPAEKSWVRILQYEGQTEAQAIAAHEAQFGPVGDSNVILRVFTSPVGSPVRR